MTTPNLGMTKPVVGADADTWGNELNADLDQIDTFAGLFSASHGTWTPTDASGAGLTLTVNGAGYIKTSSGMLVWGDITFPSTADGTQICIGGLPATVLNSTGAGGGFPIHGLSTDNGKFVKNTATFKIYQVAGTARPNSGYSAGNFYFQAWYPTA